MGWDRARSVPHGATEWVITWRILPPTPRPAASLTSLSNSIHLSSILTQDKTCMTWNNKANIFPKWPGQNSEKVLWCILCHISQIFCSVMVYGSEILYYVKFSLFLFVWLFFCFCFCDTADPFHYSQRTRVWGLGIRQRILSSSGPTKQSWALERNPRKSEQSSTDIHSFL